MDEDMEVKNILAIDFNYIMSHFAKLYESYVCEEENPVVMWNMLDQLEITDVIHFDYRILKKLALIMKDLVSMGVKICPVNSEKDIIPILQQNPDFETAKYSLFHVGYKHDILYDKDHISQIIDFDKYDDSTWIGYLALKNKLLEISWFKSYNSTPVNQEISGYIPSELKIKGKGDIDILTKIRFSEIYFSLSPHWVPQKFHYLYDLIVSLLTKGVSIE